MIRTLVRVCAHLIIKSALTVSVLILALLGGGVLAGVSAIGAKHGSTIALLVPVAFVALVRREVRLIRSE